MTCLANDVPLGVLKTKVLKAMLTDGHLDSKAIWGQHKPAQVVLNNCLGLAGHGPAIGPLRESLPVLQAICKNKGINKKKIIGDHYTLSTGCSMTRARVSWNRQIYQLTICPSAPVAISTTCTAAAAAVVDAAACVTAFASLSINAAAITKH